MRSLVALALLLAAPASADELDALRVNAARGALQVRPRLELAKALHDRGERLTAFSLVEHVAREGHPEFLLDFHHVFHEAPASLSEEAEQALRKKVASAPGDPAPLEKLADLLLWRADFAEAIPVLERATALAPEDFSLVANLSQSLLSVGEPGRAAKLMEAWMDDHPESEQSYAHRVQLLVGKDDAAAQSLLSEAIAKHPQSGSLRGLQALLHESAGEAAEAEAAMRLAAILSDDNPAFELTLGALDAERDPVLAREHYLTAYFLDPRAGLDAPASTRITELTYQLGTERFERLGGADCKNAGCFSALLSDDNPVVVTIALKAAELSWQPWHAEMVTALLGHDDPNLRDKAASVLRRRVGPEYVPQLNELMASSDLHARGLSAFLAVRLLGEDSLPLLAAALESPAQAVQRDAIRALKGSGLSGAMDLLADRADIETDPSVKALLQTALAQ